MSYEHPTHDELVRETLLRMMEDISEDCWVPDGCKTSNTHSGRP